MSCKEVFKRAGCQIANNALRFCFRLRKQLTFSVPTDNVFDDFPREFWLLLGQFV